MQNDLIWTGDYTGLIDGEFSDRLFAAVKASRAATRPETGVLTRRSAPSSPPPRAAQDEVGWHFKEDPVTGARVGLPGSFAPRSRRCRAARAGLPAGPAAGRTFRIDTGATHRRRLRAAEEDAAPPVASSDLQSDCFVITGTQGLKKILVRGAAKDGEVRGFTILYDQAMEATAIVVAMFERLRAVRSGLQRAGRHRCARRKVEYGTGVFVSAAGHLFTDRNLIEGCKVIALPGRQRRTHRRRQHRRARAASRLWRAQSQPVGMIGSTGPNGDCHARRHRRSAGPGGGAAVTRSAQSLPPSGRPRSAAGFSGAAALDPQGRFAGMWR